MAERVSPVSFTTAAPALFASVVILRAKLAHSEIVCDRSDAFSSTTLWIIPAHASSLFNLALTLKNAAVKSSTVIG